MLRPGPGPWPVGSSNHRRQDLAGQHRSGQPRGTHLLAACLPSEGVVLAQVEVAGKENEIKAAPRLLEAINLRDKVVSGDAMLAQRDLSAQVVAAGGEYLWPVKANQPQLTPTVRRYRYVLCQRTERGVDRAGGGKRAWAH